MSEYNGKIPANVLAHIEEHTAGGFFLFYLDGNGTLDFEVSCDNEGVGRGLVSFALDTLKNIRRIEKHRYIPVEEIQEEDEDQFNDENCGDS